MIKILILRLYAGVVILFLLNSLSKILFSKGSGSSIKGFFMSLPIIAVWPLALFSREGQKVMFNHLEDYSLTDETPKKRKTRKKK